MLDESSELRYGNGEVSGAGVMHVINKWKTFGCLRSHM